VHFIHSHVSMYRQQHVVVPGVIGKFSHWALGTTSHQNVVGEGVIGKFSHWALGTTSHLFRDPFVELATHFVLFGISSS